jgi:hypothetical protein
MHRTIRYRCLVPVLMPALAAMIYLGVPQNQANAAPPPPGQGFNEGGGFITITPGSLVLTAEHDFTDVNPSYGWGFGGGYMFAPGRLFKGTIGVGFEHNVLMLDGYRFQDFGAHVVRVTPELRLGLGGDTVWVYGLVGVGGAGTIWTWDSDVAFLDDLRGRDSAMGVNFEAGVGLQGMVYRNFFLGAEVEADLGFFREKDSDDWANNDDNTFSMYQLGIELVMGWKF